LIDHDSHARLLSGLLHFIRPVPEDGYDLGGARLLKLRDLILD